MLSGEISILGGGNHCKKIPDPIIWLGKINTEPENIYGKKRFRFFNKEEFSIAINILIKEGKIFDSEDKESIVEFLRNTRELDMIAIGTYISTTESIENGSLVDFMQTFNFTDMELYDALTVLMNSVRFPKSTKKTQVISEHFANQFYECNKGGIFTSADLVYGLTYTMLVLDTILHNKLIKQKISSAEVVGFIKRHLMHDDFPKEYIEGIYKRVQEKPFWGENDQPPQQGVFSKLKKKITSVIKNL